MGDDRRRGRSTHSTSTTRGEGTCRVIPEAEALAEVVVVVVVVGVQQKE